MRQLWVPEAIHRRMRPRAFLGGVTETLKNVTHHGAIGASRACDLAKVFAWHPHQLRHNAATFLRKEFGLDGARVILGHRSPAITDLYAELDREKALDVMAWYG